MCPGLGPPILRRPTTQDTGGRDGSGAVQCLAIARHAQAPDGQLRIKHDFPMNELQKSQQLEE